MKVLLWLLERALPADARDEVVGDLVERAAARRSGRFPTALWTAIQCLVLVPSLWLERATRRLVAPWIPHTHEKDESAMERRMRELRLAARSLARSPGFTVPAVLTLAIGIGAAATIFALVNGILVKPLPYPDADRLVRIGHTAPGVGLTDAGSSRGLHLLYSERARSIEGLSTYRWNRSNVTTGTGDPQRIAVGAATAGLLPLLGAELRIGRAILPGEDRVGAPRVAVLTEGFWQDQFGSDPAVLGRTVHIDGAPHEIVGVLGTDLDFGNEDIQMWTAFRLNPSETSFGGFNVASIARLAPGATVESANGELVGLLPEAAERFEDMSLDLIASASLAPRLSPLKEWMVGDIRASLMLLGVTVAFVLLIAAGNVANLLLVRSDSRVDEMQLRRALGASRWRLFSAAATENGLLAGTGALIGVGMAFLALQLILTLGPTDLPRIQSVSLDVWTVGFAAVVAMLITVVLGTLVVAGSGSGGTASAARGVAGRRRSRRFRGALVVAQTAFALVLLSGSALMFRSLREVQRIDLGFDPENTISFWLSPRGPAYQTSDDFARFHQTLLDRIRELPGVESAGAASGLPLMGSLSGDPFLIESKPPEPGSLPPVVEMRAASEGYFETMGIPLLAGRAFERRDHEDVTGAAVITKAVADRFFPGEDPIGQRVANSLPQFPHRFSTIVGVVGDVRADPITKAPEGMIYYSLRPWDEGNNAWLNTYMAFAVRSTAATGPLMTEIRGIIRTIDPDVPVSGVAWLSETVAAATAQTSFLMAILAVAAGMGTLLGGIGLYGVVSFLTGERRREIGVRMALGARQRDVRDLVLKEGGRLAVAGLVMGVAGSLAAGPALRSVLFQVEPTDPLALSVVSVLLLIVSMTAVYVPARRAARTDPATTLREE